MMTMKKDQGEYGNIQREKIVTDIAEYGNIRKKCGVGDGKEF